MLWIMPELPPVNPEDNKKTYDDWSDVMKGKVEPKADPDVKLPRKSSRSGKIMLMVSLPIITYFISDYVCHYVGYCK